MSTNLGKTSLKRRPSNGSSMREFDRLPVELRSWLSTAVLPWRPRSVRRALDKALARSGNVRAALDQLDKTEKRLIAKDTRRIWGMDHPNATPGS